MAEYLVSKDLPSHVRSGSLQYLRMELPLHSLGRPDGHILYSKRAKSGCLKAIHCKNLNGEVIAIFINIKDDDNIVGGFISYHIYFRILNCFVICINNSFFISLRDFIFFRS